MAQMDDHAHRILRSMFQAGLFDYPTQKSVVDVEGGLATARHLAEQSIVLLKNTSGLLPLDPQHGTLHRCDWTARGYGHDLWRRIGAGGSRW